MQVQDYTQTYIDKLSWGQLQKMEKTYNDYLNLNEAAFLSNEDTQSHLLQVLDTRDNIIRQLNKLTRNLKLLDTAPSQFKWEQSPH